MRHSNNQYPHGWQPQTQGYGIYHRNQNPNCHSFTHSNDREGGSSGSVSLSGNGNQFIPPFQRSGMCQRNGMCHPQYQQNVHSSSSQQLQCGGMTTLSHHEMCSLQRENPDVYILIEQQRLQIYQQRMQLDMAWKEVSNLRQKVEKLQSQEREKRNMEKRKDDDKESVGEKEKYEDIPLSLDVLKKNRSQSPSSQLTETTQIDSLPTKKRILEAAHLNSQTHCVKREDVEQQPLKKRKPLLPDLAKAAALLSAATSPRHKENMVGTRKKSGSLPDLATVAATLAAATSPRFKRGEIVTRERNGKTGTFSFVGV